MSTPFVRKVSSLTTIGGAMLAGVVAFAGVVIALGPTATPDTSNQGITYTLVGLSVLLLSTHFMVLRVVTAKASAQVAARRAEALAEVARGEVPSELFHLGVLALALGESIALLGPVAYLVGGSPLAAVPLVLGLGWMVAHFPSQDRLREAVERAGRANH